MLIVNADDYGLTVGVSRAILRAHREGVVTSTSLLALAPGFDRTVAWLDDAPGLGTGAHLAVVGEDPPLLTAAEIPSLVDRRGRLPSSWKRFLPLLAARRIDPDDLRREFGAQLEKMVTAGRVIDHLDTHQNIHLWPAVRDVLFDVGQQYGVHSIRITRSSARGPVGATVRRLADALEQRCRAQRWSYPDASAGLDGAGGQDLPVLVDAVNDLARTTVHAAELAAHPGEAGDADLARYRWGYRWADELDALCSPDLRACIERSGFRLGRFSDLAVRAPG